MFVFFRRFHRREMNCCVVWTIILVYFTQNVCFGDDQMDTMTADATTSSTASPPKIYVSPEKYRLPRAVLPEFYKLNIFTHINDDEGFKFYGDVRIKVNIYIYF